MSNRKKAPVVRTLRSRVAERKADGVCRHAEKSAMPTSELMRIREALGRVQNATMTVGLANQIVRNHRSRVRQLPPRTVATYVTAVTPFRATAPASAPPPSRDETLRLNRLDRYARRIAQRDLGNALHATVASRFPENPLALGPLSSPLSSGNACAGVRSALVELAHETLHAAVDRLPDALAANFATLRRALLDGATTTGARLFEYVDLTFDHWEAIVTRLLAGNRRTVERDVDGGARLSVELAVQTHYVAAIMVVSVARARMDGGSDGDDGGVGERRRGGDGGGAADGGREMSREQVLLLYRLNRANLRLVELAGVHGEANLGLHLQMYCISTALAGFSSIDLTEVLVRCHSVVARSVAADRSVRRQKALWVEWIHRCLATDAGRGLLAAKLANMERTKSLGATRHETRLRRAVHRLVWDEFVSMSQTYGCHRAILTLAYRAESQIRLQLQNRVGNPKNETRRRSAKNGPVKRERDPTDRMSGSQFGGRLQHNRMMLTNVAVTLGCMCRTRRDLRDVAASLRYVVTRCARAVPRSRVLSYAEWFTWVGALNMLIDVLYALHARAECLALAVVDCSVATAAYATIVYGASEPTTRSAAPKLAAADNDGDDPDAIELKPERTDNRNYSERVEALRQRNRVALRRKAIVWLHDFRHARTRRHKSLDAIMAECVAHEFDTDATVLGTWYRSLVAARQSLSRRVSNGS